MHNAQSYYISTMCVTIGELHFHEKEYRDTKRKRYYKNAKPKKIILFTPHNNKLITLMTIKV